MDRGHGSRRPSGPCLTGAIRRRLANRLRKKGRDVLRLAAGDADDVGPYLTYQRILVIPPR